MGSKNTKLMVKEAIKDIKYIMEHSKNVKIEPMIMARKEAEERLRMVKFNTMRMKQMRQAQAVSSQEKAKSVEDIRKAYEDQVCVYCTVSG